jgi:hypothetical protein
MSRGCLLAAFAAPLLSGIFLACGSAVAQTMDVELVLAVDVSGSVDAGEQELQRTGLSAAFRDPAAIAAIRRLRVWPSR